MKALRHYFMEEFRELYRSEKRWLRIMPRVARNMPPRAMERATAQHLEQTAARVVHLGEIFHVMIAKNGKEPQEIKRLLNEADEVLTAVSVASAALSRKGRQKKAAGLDSWKLISSNPAFHFRG